MDKEKSILELHTKATYNCLIVYCLATSINAAIFLTLSTNGIKSSLSINLSSLPPCFFLLGDGTLTD